ncbi:MAG: hypothetical protein U5M23_12935 [Marinagarivorans sp.]|nr:hypothetical protein [Marinagarivorans sp.]
MKPKKIDLKHRHVINLPSSRSKQQGMATLLVVLLVGVGLVSISVGAMHAIRSTQERQTAARAQINVQAGAWAAAEAVRQHLLTLDAAAVEAITSATPLWTLSGYSGFVPTVKFTANSGKTASNSYRITAQITATDNLAKASSLLEVIYEVTPATSAVTEPDIAAISYVGDFRSTGGIAFLKDAGDTTPYEINVIGNVTFTNISMLGLDVLRSTKSITLTGTTSPIKKVHANCDVYVSGASMPKNIQATRHIFVQNTTNQGYGTESCDSEEIRANGSVSIGSSTCAYKSVFALAGKGGFSYCEAPATNAAGLTDVKSEVTTRFGAAAVNPTNSAVAGGVFINVGTKSQLIKSNNDIIVQGTANMGQLHAERDIAFKGNANTLSGFARYARDLIPNTSGTYNDLFGVGNSSGKDQKTAGAYNVAIDKALSVSLESEKLDVNDFKQYANYIFSIDGAGRKRVVVKGVKNSSGTALDYNAIAIDGKGYYLRSHGGHDDWLCTTLTATIPTGCTAKIGLGHGAYNALISYGNMYDATLGKSVPKWNLNGISLAPGIAFFEGDLNIGSGTYYNTFLTTGNITNSGTTIVYAPNFAGFDGKQIKNGVSKSYAPQGICKNTVVPNVIPTQFCTATTFDFTAAQEIGNYALLAGTCGNAAIKPCTKAEYLGGNITTGESANFYGAIKAGNLFTSAGDSTAHGYISALGQAVQASDHKLTAKTTVDLRDLPPGFKPTGGASRPGKTTPGTASSTKILWSRYL